MGVGSEAEAVRVRRMLRRDRKDRAAEQDRREAAVAVESGDLSRLQDTVVPPTPEQLAQGEWVRVAVDMEQQTARSHKTVRRVVTSIPARLYRRGVIGSDEVSACRWYRTAWELTGLDGRIQSVELAKEIFLTQPQMVQFTEQQIVAQDELRFVRALMTKRYIPFFELIVLHDMPMKRAERVSKVRQRGGNITFRECAEELAAAKEMMEKG